MKSGSEKFHRDADDNARDKLAEYLEEAGAAEVYAVDPTVTETAKELGQAASSVINKVWLFGVGSDTERQELAQTLNRIDSDLLPALRHACRRDLGLAVRVGPVRA
jgi:hypothetical protein